MLDGDATRLAASFAAEALTLHSQESTEHTLREIVAIAARTVAGAEHAGATLLRRRTRSESPAFSDELVRMVDEAQRETGEGPSFDAMRGQRSLHVADLASEERWPRFAPRARKLGIESMVCCWLGGEGRPPGVLNLYASAAGAFDGQGANMAHACAAHATAALSRITLIESLGTAVRSRQVIGEATGILMERHGMSSQDAFVVLKKASQESNVKLREIAALLVESRDVPASAGASGVRRGRGPGRGAAGDG
jgi:transcriptional regulator with GAF, ATPase, and Fis domain